MPPGVPGRGEDSTRSYQFVYDVALRDFGLLLGALTLARLATAFDGDRDAERAATS